MSGTNQLHCAVCGSAVRTPFRAPQPEMAPDLDMRPAEPARSTLAEWIAICPTCKAAAPDLSALPAGAADVVRSEAYRALLDTASEDTLPFLRWALICRETGDARSAAEATLQAAWAADDAADTAGGAALRREVAVAWGEPADHETALRLIDVLRRAGEFDAAEARAARLAAQDLNETTARIVSFQRDRIAERDIGRHLISSAVPPPATAPHVAQGKRPGPGFWERLFKR